MAMPEATVETKKHNISIRTMPVDLWRSFRMYCMEHDLTVENEIVNAINEYLVLRTNRKDGE